MQPILLIPAYEPSSELLHLVDELVRNGIEKILVVNDGSTSTCNPIFDSFNAFPQVKLLRHAVNLGKGAALKTGFNAILCDHPDAPGVITCDADGQHSCADILRVMHAAAESPGKLILGARTFSDDVPLRSRFGNELTRTVMHMVTGQKLLDTQTGLRAIPVSLLPSLMQLRSQGYEFEMDMLIACKELNVRIVEQPIATIYIEGNRSSHFNPLLDSMRIYFVLLRFALVGLLTALLDNIVFLISYSVSGNIAVSQILARVVALGFNYQAVKQRVFNSHIRHRVALARYLALVAVSGLASYAMIQVMIKKFPISVLVAKLSAETVLFFMNFMVERDFVFIPPPSENGTASANSSQH